MTAIVDEVSAQRKLQGPKCSLKAFFSTQPAADAQEFLKIIKVGTTPAAAIWRALAKRGYAFGVNRVKSHQGGVCRECYPATPSCKKGRT